MVSSFRCLSFLMTVILLSVSLLLSIATTNAFVDDAFSKIRNDYLSLTRRVTARHILVQDEEIATVLKRKIRQECIDKEMFVIDAFEKAAKKYSKDDSTKYRGGLIGERVPQGVCRSPQLDEYCFSVRLGEVIGPMESDYGYHLILVSERTNCPKLDGANTVMMQTRGDDIFGTLREGKQFGKPNIPQLFVDQIGFWSCTLVAGGVCAELSEKLVSVIH